MIGWSALIIYLAIVAALLMIIIYIIRDKHLLVAALILLTISHSAAFSVHILGFKGWSYPTEFQALPIGSRVVWADVVEPSHSTDGAIYFLLSIDEPRLYRVPYDRELHRQLTDAKKGMKRIGDYMVIGKQKGKRRRGAGSDIKDPDEKSPFKIKNKYSELRK